MRDSARLLEGFNYTRGYRERHIRFEDDETETPLGGLKLDATRAGSVS